MPAHVASHALLVFLACLSASALVCLALPLPPVGLEVAAFESLTRILGGRDASTAFDIRISAALTQCAAAAGGGNRRVELSAQSACDAVFIAGRYLAAVLNASFAWQLTGGVQIPNLPASGWLPAVPGGVMQVCRAVPYTYYQNVVQSSYSNVWWDIDRWMAELDWMALHGVNIALAYTGQESLWRDTFLHFGLNQTTLDGYFGGPAYLSWSRGQGLMGIGGPLPEWWYAQQLQQAQKLVSAHVELGIVPVLPAFQGNVPPALHFVFPAANISTDGWLDVFDPLFGQIQDAYMQRLLAAFPDQLHFFEADGLFSHASGPWLRAKHDGEQTTASAPAASNSKTNTPSSPLESAVAPAPTPDPDAQARSHAAYESFAKWDPQAVWVYQTWIWRGFNTPADLAYMTGWLAGAPPGRFFLLDQTAERVPIWTKFGNFSFCGQPFAWLAMSNMGGNMGLVGSLDAVNRGTVDALTHSGGALAAIGIDPEGINTNPAYFEFVLASAWRAAPVDSRAWMQDFGVRRCGRERDDVRAAYALLHDTVYRENQTNFEHHMAYCSVALPLVNDTWDKTLVRPSFAAGALAEVWRLLLEGVRSGECSSAGVRYDLIDVAREFISLFPCVATYDSLLAATTLDDLSTAAIAMNDTLTDLDHLLGTHRGFMVGPWIADARALGLRAGASAADLDLLELNARAQISTWLPLPPTGANKLYDYANKQFSGLTKDYYLLRYSAFATLAAEAILSGGTPADVDQAAFVDDLTYIGQQWMGARAPASVYPTEPVGDALEVAAALYTKYAANMAV